MKNDGKDYKHADNSIMLAGLELVLFWPHCKKRLLDGGGWQVINTLPCKQPIYNSVLFSSPAVLSVNLNETK